MAFVYIIFSKSSDLFYVGSTADLEQRMAKHRAGTYAGSFTSRVDDWELFFSVSVGSITVARKIEAHIKRMKSRTYIENLGKYPEISKKLITRYSDTQSR